MASTVPADLLELKARLDAWRESRRHPRERVPDDLREAIIEMCRRHSTTRVRRTLKFDPRRFYKPATPDNSASAAVRQKPQTAFFTLPPPSAWPTGEDASSSSTTGYRLQLDRPDGSRLTLMLPALDPETISRLCAEFLRG